MPYIAGTYSLPPGSTATPNTTIESAKYNTVLNDLATAQNTARPVVGGGTGGVTAVDGNDGLNTKGADIASGSTTNLAAAAGVYLNITGTTTINSFGTVPAGAERVLTFTGILTITYNATSMILPGAASITTAVGDTATFRSLGGGNWRCVDYLRASGQAPTNVLVSPNITGATTITDTAAGSLLTITSTDAGASEGPGIDLYRNSASPAALDLGSTLYASFKNSAAVKKTFGIIYHVAQVVTSAAESGAWDFWTIRAGVSASRMVVGSGMYMTGATGGDKGAGTFNATTLYQNGSALPFTKSFESAQQTITVGGALTLAHGLGVQPKLYFPVLQCTTNDGGYVVGNEVLVNPNMSTTDTSGRGISVVPDATNINIRFGDTAHRIIDKADGSVLSITTSRWRLVVRAWA